MEDLFIESTQRSPEINFRATTNQLSLKGRSQPEDILDFFDPVMKWFNQYITETKGPVELNFGLDYFNTASAKIIYEMLTKLKNANDRGVDYQVNWQCEDYDDDMKDVATQLADLTGIKVNLLIL